MKTPILFASLAIFAVAATPINAAPPETAAPEHSHQHAADQGAQPDSMMARAQLFPQIGGFDETKTPADDTDWIFRARQVGVGYHTLPETLLIRRVHAENLSTVKPVGKPQVLGLLRGAIARKRAGPS